jgi:hypothetical protein
MNRWYILIFLFCLPYVFSIRIDYDTLLQVFNLQKQINNCLQETIDITNGLELIYPTKIMDFKYEKRGVIVGYSKKNKKNLAFKFELKSRVRV